MVVFGESLPPGAACQAHTEVGPVTWTLSSDGLSLKKAAWAWATKAHASTSAEARHMTPSLLGRRRPWLSTRPCEDDKMDIPISPPWARSVYKEWPASRLSSSPIPWIYRVAQNGAVGQYYDTI